MEPDVIRMYSSSPPPLDDGGEDEDDEFGEFGGFSGVSASVSFTSFDGPNFTSSTDDFVSSNHFMSDKMYSNNAAVLTDLNSANASKDRNCFTELSKPPDGTIVGLDTHRNEMFLCHAAESPVKDGVKTLAEQMEIVDSAEKSFEPGTIRTVIKTDQQESTDCNGSIISDDEILTNGYSSDIVSFQQEIEVNIPKEQKEIYPEISLSSPSSLAQTFADFTAFPNTYTSINCVCTVNVMNDCSSEEKILKNQVGFSIENNDNLNVDVEEPSKLSSENVVVQNIDSDRAASQFSHFPAKDNVLSNNNSGSDCETKSQTTASVEKVETLHSEKFVNRICGIPQKEEEEMEGAGSDVFRSTVPFVQESTADTEDSSLVYQSCSENGQQVESVAPSTSVSVSEEFASFCQAESPDDIEDFGEFGTTNDKLSLPNPEGLIPSNITELPTEVSSQFETIDIKDFGATNICDFADFSQSKMSNCISDRITEAISDSVGSISEGSAVTEEVSGHLDKAQKLEEGSFAEFCTTEDFADFSSSTGNQDMEWNAFADQPCLKESTSWAAFGNAQSVDFTEDDKWQSSSTTEGGNVSSAQSGRMDGTGFVSFQGPTESDSNVSDQTSVNQAALVCRLQKVFQACFPPCPMSCSEENITSLKLFLEPVEHQEETGSALGHLRELRNVWSELQDIHDAYGLKYQWCGSHSNKKLLSSLGIDTRNILFTGQKKQPVIVPMYAASLGMLEPTKEPVKPVSAAEKIASIAQAPLSPEMSPCTADQAQEILPPVQFDWSSSGLTNPLDGVDPELYELTTAKLESTSTSNRMADAFAKLMSTVEKTSTSARKRKKDENLSEEAAKVIASLPDLSFMQAKVLMFPATLTPLTSSQKLTD
ncbi:aftiphilin a isoform X2 [Erpetoichthys calabaricus]|uniref:Aftiphilin a n=1 Tax=Erpetoichthys calabaricus TaxID=27687 RepID=A0A8C4XGN1_ERPCA|nr:aftiphilin a isoform X2 [Erpetoichthys calabaricus]